MEKDTNNILVAIGGLFGGGGFLVYIFKFAFGRFFKQQDLQFKELFDSRLEQAKKIESLEAKNESLEKRLDEAIQDIKAIRTITND